MEDEYLRILNTIPRSEIGRLNSVKNNDGYIILKEI
jgi:hypothetical protein